MPSPRSLCRGAPAGVLDQPPRPHDVAGRLELGERPAHGPVRRLPIERARSSAAMISAAAADACAQQHVEQCSATSRAPGRAGAEHRLGRLDPHLARRRPRRAGSSACPPRPRTGTTGSRSAAGADRCRRASARARRCSRRRRRRRSRRGSCRRSRRSPCAHGAGARRRPRRVAEVPQRVERGGDLRALDLLPAPDGAEAVDHEQVDRELEDALLEAGELRRVGEVEPERVVDLEVLGAPRARARTSARAGAGPPRRSRRRRAARARRRRRSRRARRRSG